MPDIMKMGKNPNYLGYWDLDDQPGRELTLTIAKIVDEDVVTNGQKEVCTVAYWTDTAYKPMILNVTNKKVPVYFEYKYGIDFEKEKEFLFLNGFLDETNKPTAKGEAAIQKHAKVIENHTPPKPVWNYEEAKKQTLQQRNSLRINCFKEYEFVANKKCCDVCAKLNGKHFSLSALKIGVNAPPMHEGCSCSICAYSDRAEYEAWLDSVVKENKRNRRK